jgi:hypothetical protein
MTLLLKNLLKDDELDEEFHNLKPVLSSEAINKMARMLFKSIFIQLCL